MTVGMKAAAVIKDERGIATSLLETALVIAVAAVISSVALVSAMNNIGDAKLSQATADTQMIGIAIQSFMNDTGFAPAYQFGNARGPEDNVFLLLQSGGSDPTSDSFLRWPLSNTGNRDLLTNQLVNNQPGYSGTGNFLGIPYPRMGQISWSRYKGWNGPYVASMPQSDPWDDRYLANVQFLTQQGIQTEQQNPGGFTLGTGERAAVFVISAGPNRQLDTRFDQVADGFAAGGDDIIYRIQ